MSKRRGEEHPHHKLTEREVLAIRDEHASGSTLRTIVSHHQVSLSTVWSIVNRRSWQWLDADD